MCTTKTAAVVVSLEIRPITVMEVQAVHREILSITVMAVPAVHQEIRHIIAMEVLAVHQEIRHITATAVLADVLEIPFITAMEPLVANPGILSTVIRHSVNVLLFPPKKMEAMEFVVIL